MTRRARLTGDAFGPEIESPADDLMQEAWEAPTPAARRKIARAALERDFDCLDAWWLLALEAQSPAEKLALLREAVRVGDRLWEPLIGDEEMEWWGFIGTRSYMRAMQSLALALEDAGDLDEAEALYRRLLEMNPNDNQGIRSLLLRLLLVQGRTDDARPLVVAYSEDWAVETKMAALMLAWMDGAPGDQLLADIARLNEHALPVLADALRYDTPPAPPRLQGGYVTAGSREEARLYASEFHAAWRRQPKAAAALSEAVGR